MYRGQDPGFSGNNMPLIEFDVQAGENIYYRAIPNRKWYVITWKIISGVTVIIIFTFIINSLLAGLTESALNHYLGAVFSGLLTKFLFLGVIPLGAATWVIEDLVCVYIGEFILTDQRIWTRGSPYAWSSGDIPLDDISSLVWRRDAIFIRLKSSHKIQVHMFSEGKLFAKAYQDFVQKS
jgi:hypothetical protein